MQKKINIAIDGFSGCGKSTLAKSLANELDYIYIDSGAMYRAVTYMFLQKGISPDNMSAIDHEMATIDIHFKRKGNSDQLYLNGQQLEDELRSVEVTARLAFMLQYQLLEPDWSKYKKNKLSTKAVLWTVETLERWF